MHTSCGADGDAGKNGHRPDDPVNDNNDNNNNDTGNGIDDGIDDDCVRKEEGASAGCGDRHSAIWWNNFRGLGSGTVLV